MATTRQSTLTSRHQKAENAKARQAKKAEGQTPKLCECGCHGYTVNPSASFITGHDQRLKGILLRRFDEGDERAAVELMRRGWKSNDDLQERAEKRRLDAEAKAQAKEERETKRRMIAMEREQEKADKAELKATRKAAEKAAAEVEVAMPKRSRRARTTAPATAVA